jgi:hypothetical protein
MTITTDATAPAVRYAAGTAADADYAGYLAGES